MFAFGFRNISKSVMILFVLAITVLFFSNNGYAQIKSVKKLKNDTKDLKIKEESTKQGDPWTIKDIVTPDELVKEIKNTKSKKPLILQVGFEFLYKTGHIPGAKYVGPASEVNGINLIKNEVKKLKKNTNIVIYCGCCPWNHCPNVRPAFKILKNLGFTNVKALVIKQDFGKDWSDKGYPVVKSNG